MNTLIRRRRSCPSCYLLLVTFSIWVLHRQPYHFRPELNSTSFSPVCCIHINILRKLLRLVQITILAWLLVLSISNLHHLLTRIKLSKNILIFFDSWSIVFFQSMANSFPNVNIMLNIEMNFIFYWAAKWMFHCVAERQIHVPVDSQPWCSLSS